jgi:hypothetical protein
MIKPEVKGWYQIEIFNGERADPIDGIGYFDGENWDYLNPHINCNWHPNNLVIGVGAQIPDHA